MPQPRWKQTTEDDPETENLQCDRDDADKLMKGPREDRLYKKKLNANHQTMKTSRYITERNAFVYRKNKVLTKETERKKNLPKK